MGFHYINSLFHCKNKLVSLFLQCDKPKREFGKHIMKNKSGCKTDETLETKVLYD